MIKHIGTSAIMDLLLRMLTCIEPQQLRQDVLRVSRATTCKKQLFSSTYLYIYYIYHHPHNCGYNSSITQVIQVTLTSHVMHTMEWTSTPHEASDPTYPQSWHFAHQEKVGVEDAVISKLLRLLGQGQRASENCFCGHLQCLQYHPTATQRLTVRREIP